MNNLKITVSGGSKTGESHIVRALEYSLKDIYTKVTVEGDVSGIAEEDYLDKFFSIVKDETITLEEVHRPIPTGYLDKDLELLGFIKDTINNNNSYSYTVTRDIKLNIQDGLIYFISEVECINGYSNLGKYNFYKVLDLINSLKAFK